MVVAPLAYYHDSRATRATIGSTNVLVRDCEAAARDKSLVINVSYPDRTTHVASIDPQLACKND